MIKAGETITASRLRRLLTIAILAALHCWTLVLMIWSEPDLVGQAAFLLAWGVLNAFWLVLLRRPAASAALAVTMLMVLIALSVFKHDVLFMTVNFVDLMVVDQDTLGFLLTVTPGLWANVVIACLLVAVICLILALARPQLGFDWEEVKQRGLDIVVAVDPDPYPGRSRGRSVLRPAQPRLRWSRARGPRRSQPGQRLGARFQPDVAVVDLG